tara:strand:+ start:1575 stop:1847 length:273 start_codon:yes stop_codon:yes gene_type:complete
LAAGAGAQKEYGAELPTENLVAQEAVLAAVVEAGACRYRAALHRHLVQTAETAWTGMELRAEAEALLLPAKTQPRAVLPLVRGGQDHRPR